MTNHRENTTSHQIRIIKEYPADSVAVPLAMRAWMRSNHAGETGAVWIYRGALLALWSPKIRRMAKNHIQSEKRHLVVMDQLVPVESRCRLLMIWKILGAGLGFLSTLFGYKTFCSTISAVESFVLEHYNEQIEFLNDHEGYSDLQLVLKRCCAEEVHHRNDAESGLSGQRGILDKIWVSLVENGSVAAVSIAKII